jgi:TatD family-associated radical SAM protein
MKDIYAYRVYDNLYINLTNRCCNNCAFCIRNEGDGIENSGSLWLSSEPSAAQVIEAIKGFSPDEYEDVVFCGYGEPTYALGVMLEVAAYAHSIRKKTRLNTNGLGRLIFGADIVPMLKPAIDYVSVSLNESDATKYDALCRHAFAGAYDEILRFTRDCVNAGIDTTMTVVNTGDIDVEKCAEVCAKTGARFRVREKI